MQDEQELSRDNARNGSADCLPVQLGSRDLAGDEYQGAIA